MSERLLVVDFWSTRAPETVVGNLQLLLAEWSDRNGLSVQVRLEYAADRGKAGFCNISSLLGNCNSRCTSMLSDSRSASKFYGALGECFIGSLA